MNKRRNINKNPRKPSKVMPWWAILFIILAAITIGVARILK